MATFSGDRWPTAIAVDQTNTSLQEVFIAVRDTVDEAKGGIWRKGKTTVVAAEEVLPNLVNPNSVALDAAQFYWTDSGVVGQGRRTGADQVSTVAYSTPSDVAVDEQRVYWADHGTRTMFSAAKGAFVQSNISVIGVMDPGIIPAYLRPDIGSSRVYFGTRGGNPTFLGSTEKAVDDVIFETLAAADLGGVDLDSDSVYFTVPLLNRVWRTNKANKTAIQVGGDENGAGSIAANSAVVVWGTSTGDLRAFYKSQGQVRTLFRHPTAVPMSIVLDAQYAYWIQGKAVVRTPL